MGFDPTNDQAESSDKTAGRGDRSDAPSEKPDLVGPPVSEAEVSDDNNTKGGGVADEFDDTEAEPDAAKQPDNVDRTEKDCVDPNADGGSFSPAVAVAGESSKPLNEFGDWDLHPASKSRKRGVSLAALVTAANDPANIPPIVLLPMKDGLHPVMDGRRRWQALKEAHGEASEVMVRCVMFNGSESAAVQAVCDDALGGAPRTAIETARAVLNVQRIARISQKMIGERYPVLKKDQVSRMTIAAVTVEQHPEVFGLLDEPDRVPIDLCVKFAQFMKGASDDQRAAVLEEAQVHQSAGTYLNRTELFEALGIEIEGVAVGRAKADPFAPVVSTDVFGSDDQPVGAMEMLSDDVTRIRLPDPVKITAEEREEAAEAFIRQIRIYFSLDAA